MESCLVTQARLTDHWTPGRVWGDGLGTWGSSVSEALVWIWVVGQFLLIEQKTLNIPYTNSPTESLVWSVLDRSFILSMKILFYLIWDTWIQINVFFFCFFFFCCFWDMNIFKYLVSYLTLHWIACSFVLCTSEHNLYNKLGKATSVIPQTLMTLQCLCPLALPIKCGKTRLNLT